MSTPRVRPPFAGLKGRPASRATWTQRTPLMWDKRLAAANYAFTASSELCRKSNDQPAEEREKTPASARDGEPEEKRPSPAPRVKRRTGHPRERKDSDGREEQEPKSKERREDNLQPRDGRLPSSRNRVRQPAHGKTLAQFKLLLFWCLRLITNPRPPKNASG